MIERHSPQWEPLDERLTYLMSGDFLPDTRRQEQPCLPIDVICWVTKDFYKRLLAHRTATVQVDGLPDGHVCDAPELGALLLFEDQGGCFVRRITRAAAHYLCQP